MVDLGSLVLLMSIFGTKVAIVYVVVGLVIAVVGGTLIEKLHMENYVEEFIRSASGVDFESPDLTRKERVIYAKDQVVSTFKKVLPYILVGVGIGLSSTTGFLKAGLRWCLAAIILWGSAGNSAWRSHVR